MIRYGVYFGAGFILMVSLPAMVPSIGNWVPALGFYAPFFYLADRIHEVVPVDFFRRPLVILGIGTLFWGIAGTFLGLFLRMWPFRSHLLLRLGVAVITFSGGAILLYSAAQLAETLR